ncbi:biofilm stress and motility protein A [Klebsiella michiganensis]|nr:biofilm stress and motility protein A [Klebsiella michiganensis]
MVMRRFTPWLLAIALTGCSALQGTPKAPPPATNHPQEIQRNQTTGLQKMGTVSVLMYGSPMDVEGCAEGQSRGG